MESRVPDSLRDNLPSSVAIVGCGGVGSWVALLFSQFRDCRRIALFDGDVLEESNLERTPYKMEQLGMSKVDALKEIILERRDEIEVTLHDYITEDNKMILDEYELAVAACDDAESRNLVLEHDNSINVGYDVTENYDHITVSEAQIWQIDDDGDNYEIEPSWSGPAMLGAVLTVMHVVRDVRPASVSTKVNHMFVENDELDDNYRYLFMEPRGD